MSVRRAGTVAAIAAAPFALAYRFAVVYRVRAGYPARRPPRQTPSDVGLPFEPATVRSDGGLLAAWFIPARGGAPGPGVVLVHGWESARDRSLPNAAFLHAAGFHCLLFDVRGHGDNPEELLPISGGEFGADALAAFDALMARPEVTTGGILGHSMGGVGAILAAAADRRCAAVVSVSSPADPGLLTRETFRLARLPIPGPVARPLAWLTARVYVRPRGHSIRAVSAMHALRTYERPILLVHGDRDAVIPVTHLDRLERAARRSPRPADVPIGTLVMPGGQHSWLYEDPRFRRTVASFLALALGGPYAPEDAGDRAALVEVRRPPDSGREGDFGALGEALPHGTERRGPATRWVTPPAGPRVRARAAAARVVARGRARAAATRAVARARVWRRERHRPGSGDR